jgi:hypothetical protein
LDFPRGFAEFAEFQSSLGKFFIVIVPASRYHIGSEASENISAADNTGQAVARRKGQERVAQPEE